MSISNLKAVATEDHLNTWFSGNTDKAWVEKFFLLYTPVWMGLMAMMMLTGWDKSFSDTLLLIHSMLVAMPLLLIPMFIHYRSKAAFNLQTVLESYWFKANLYIALFSFFGNYFGTFYFFDTLGMVYNYPNATTHLGAAILSKDQQTVPLIMYFYTHAYFMTYHSTAVIVLRKLNRALANKLSFIAMSFVVGYLWAWVETKAMANPLMATSFYYKNMAAMLAYGSAIYATYFIVSFPIFYFIDEHNAKEWNTVKVCAAALSASMLVFYLLDACAHIVGHL